MAQQKIVDLAEYRRARQPEPQSTGAAQSWYWVPVWVPLPVWRPF